MWCLVVRRELLLFPKGLGLAALQGDPGDEWRAAVQDPERGAQQDRGVVGGGRRRSPHPPAQGILDLLVGQVVPRRQPGVTGDGGGPLAKTQQKALRRRQEKEGPTAETP